MSPEEPGRVIERANVARAEWVGVPEPRRLQRPNALTDAVEVRADELATAGTSEQGKLLRESKGEDTKRCAEERFSVGEAVRTGL